MYRNYNPAHSAFLIHWTGKDIDERYDKKWTNVHSSQTNKEVAQLYLKRLKSILKYGLWMTKNKEDESFHIKGKRIKRPYLARTCFSELKLSAVRSHASEYGRLGIGFKRPFLFNRLGIPIVYYHPEKNNWFFPPYFPDRTEYKSDDFFACFFKHMTRKSSDGTIEFKYYDESEWRIIYSKEIENKLKESKQKDVINNFVKPCEVKDEDFQKYIKENKNINPEYLIPIKDKWFCMIIYPSLAVKVEAESDEEIRNLIENKKPKKSSNINLYYNNPAPWELYSKPIEIDLDSCRNF